MQLKLNLADSPSSDEGLWGQLDETAREAVIDRLAQVIAKVVTDLPVSRREDKDE
jgi:hypothetical protein